MITAQIGVSSEPTVAWGTLFVIAAFIFLVSAVGCGIKSRRYGWPAGIGVGSLVLAAVLLAGIIGIRNVRMQMTNDFGGMPSFVELHEAPPEPTPIDPIVLGSSIEAEPTPAPAEAKSEPKPTEKPALDSKATTRQAEIVIKRHQQQAQGVLNPTATDRQAEEGKTPVAVVKPKPDWVDNPTKEGPGRKVVVVGPYLTVGECDEHLDEALLASVAEFVRTKYGSSEIVKATITSDYLRHKVMKGQWIEPVKSSVGNMVQVHVLVDFDSAVRAALVTAMQEYRQQQRLMYLGSGVAGVLLVVGVVHLGLRRFAPVT